MKTNLLRILTLFLFFMAVTSMIHAQEVTAEDKASNYTTEQFDALENLGTGFGDWRKLVNGSDASVVLQSASDAGSNAVIVDTEGLAFKLSASAAGETGQRVDLGREFNTEMADGQQLNFQFSWNWTGGIKGFALHNGNWDTESAALSVDFDITGYYVNGDSVAAHATEEDWQTWREEGVAFDVTVTKNGSNLDYVVDAITEGSNVSFEGTVEGVSVDRINFFNDGGQDWDSNGRGSLFVNSLKITSSTTTSIEDQQMIEAFTLAQNYPNPFNPTTVIQYGLNSASEVRLSVYNMLGQEVAILESGVKSAGLYTSNFDATGLTSGIYIYRLTTETGSITKKMMLVK